MNKIPNFLGYMIIACTTILLINHWYRGLMWQPLVFLWLSSLSFLLVKEGK